MLNDLHVACGLWNEFDARSCCHYIETPLSERIMHLRNCQTRWSATKMTAGDLLIRDDILHSDRHLIWPTLTACQLWMSRATHITIPTLTKQRCRSLVSLVTLHHMPYKYIKSMPGIIVCCPTTPEITSTHFYSARLAVCNKRPRDKNIFVA